MSAISHRQVSAICRGINERVKAFLQPPLEGEWPYLWLDATYVKVRKHDRVVSVVAIIACAVRLDGRREIIGMGIGESQAKQFWLSSLLGLKERVLQGHQRQPPRLEDGNTASVLCELAAVASYISCTTNTSLGQQGELVGGTGRVATGVRAVG